MSGRIDPRMRERHVSTKRAQGRRRLRALGVVVVVILACFVAFGVSRSPIFSVREITVSGATVVAHESVLEAAGIDDGDPILYLDLGAAQRRVEELPWVDTARITRDLPSTVRIDVTERAAIAWVRDPDGGSDGGEQFALVDTSGRILEIVGTPPALPEITGLTFSTFAAGTSASSDAPTALLAALPADLASRVGVVSYDDGPAGESLVVTLVDGPDIVFGDNEDLPAKASAALAVLARLGDDPVSVIDVSVPLAPTTRP